jgi:Glycosyltransferase GT-D fold
VSFPPTVLGDHATIDRIWVNRLSFARFGDGEYRLVTGRGTKTQRHHPALQDRLASILRYPDRHVLVGILDLYSGKPVADPWPARLKTEARYGTPRWAAKHLNLELTYGCASVTRMCNWALGDRELWWRKLRELWRGRDVLLVTGSNKGMVADTMLKPDARSVITLRLAANTDAWERFPWLLEYCRGWARSGNGNALVLLALGATATVLAHDLGAAGLQALDIGHLPQSWQGISPKTIDEP